MAVALVELGARAAGRDRLADPAQVVGARVAVEELLPGRDDPARVGPDLVHRGEAHRGRVGPERGAQPVDLPGVHDDEDRRARRQAVADEGRRPAHELLLAPVEERAVAEPRRGVVPRPGSSCRRAALHRRPLAEGRAPDRVSPGSGPPQPSRRNMSRQAAGASSRLAAVYRGDALMAVPLAADYPFLDVLWSMLIFMAFVLWIWLAITCFADIFRRHDMGGFLKALWIIVIIVIPYFGVLVYLIAYHRIDGRSQREGHQGEARRRSTSACWRGRRVRRRGRRDREGPRACCSPARSPRTSSTASRRTRWRADAARVAGAPFGVTLFAELARPATLSGARGGGRRAAQPGAIATAASGVATRKLNDSSR